MLRIWCGIISTKYLDLILIVKCIEIFPKFTGHNAEYFCNELSRNSALTIDMLLAYPDFPWNWQLVSNNMNINIISEHPEFNWDWDCVSQNRSVTMEVVLLNINKSWHWGSLSSHSNITM